MPDTLSDDEETVMFHQLFSATIRFGRAAYLYKREYGELPSWPYDSASSQAAEPSLPREGDIYKEYESSRTILGEFATADSPYRDLIHSSRDLWLTQAAELGVEELGHLIAGMKAASEKVGDWPRGSVNLHEPLVEKMLRRDDPRIWKCRDIPNAIYAWAYFDSEDIPTREDYFSDKELNDALRQEKWEADQEYQRKLKLQDENARRMPGTPEQAQLWAAILGKSPVEQLEYIATHDKYPLELYPAEIAPTIDVKVIEQLEGSLLLNLASLLNHRKIEDQNWGKFKSRLLKVCHQQGLKQTKIHVSNKSY